MRLQDGVNVVPIAPHQMATAVAGKIDEFQAFILAQDARDPHKVKIAPCHGVKSDYS
jgi:hypothetical protein